MRLFEGQMKDACSTATSEAAPHSLPERKLHGGRHRAESALELLVDRQYQAAAASAVEGGVLPSSLVVMSHRIPHKLEDITKVCL